MKEGLSMAFHGQAGRGAMREHRNRKRDEAEARNRVHRERAKARALVEAHAADAGRSDDD